MPIQAFAESDQGPYRSANEDAYGLFPQEHFYVIADGVGGRPAGQMAANETVRLLQVGIKRLLLQSPQKNIEHLLKLNIREANHLVMKKGNSDEQLSGMATTFCMAFIYQNSMYYSHYGDSRLYLLRDGDLKVLTKDHTLAQELLERNQELVTSRDKNTLTKAIGVTETSYAVVESMPLKPNDRWMIVSDGVYEKLSFDDLKNKLSSKKNISTLPREIILSARKQGATDNISVIIIENTP